jgi:hypothetical protein
MLETLREDFSRLPELLALPAPDQPGEVLEPIPEVPDDAPGPQAQDAADQLDLF